MSLANFPQSPSTLKEGDGILPTEGHFAEGTEGHFAEGTEGQ